MVFCINVFSEYVKSAPMITKTPTAANVKTVSYLNSIKIYEFSKKSTKTSLNATHFETHGENDCMENGNESTTNLTKARHLLEIIFDLISKLIPAYCSFLHSYRDHLLDTSACEDYTSPSVPLLLNNNPHSPNDISEHAIFVQLRITGDAIYNMSYIILLQEQCEYVCDNNSLQALSSYPLSQLKNRNAMFLQFIHIVNTIDEYLEVLCSHFITRICPSAAELLHLAYYHINRTGRIIKQLVFERNKVYSLLYHLNPTQSQVGGSYTTHLYPQLIG